MKKPEPQAMRFRLKRDLCFHLCDIAVSVHTQDLCTFRLIRFQVQAKSSLCYSPYLSACFLIGFNFCRFGFFFSF